MTCFLYICQVEYDISRTYQDKEICDSATLFGRITNRVISVLTKKVTWVGRRHAESFLCCAVLRKVFGTLLPAPNTEIPLDIGKQLLDLLESEICTGNIIYDESTQFSNISTVCRMPLWRRILRDQLQSLLKKLKSETPARRRLTITKMS